MASIELPHPTNATREGPVLCFKNGELTVRYDCESNDGTVVWSQLDFSEVLGLSYLHASCGTEGSQVTSSHRIEVYSDSRWLSHALGAWLVAVGNQASQQKLGGATRFRHYHIFFDD